MALTLPTITIQDDVVAQKVLDAFKGAVDSTTGLPLTPQQAYRMWLRSSLIEYVSKMRTDVKIQARIIQDEADLAAERQALQNSMTQ